MPGIDDVIDRFSGMITRKQAAALLGNEEKPNGSFRSGNGKMPSDVTNAIGLQEFIDMNRKRGVKGLSSDEAFTVNIRDSLYRVFNPIKYPAHTSQTEKRTIVLGSEGFTIKLRLHRLSSSVDSEALERGDTVLVTNALLNMQTGELKEGKGTLLRRLTHTKMTSVIDYSVLTEGMRNIDVIGKVAEVSQVREVAKLSGSGEVAVSDCVLSDMQNTIGVSLWGSSALASSRIHANDLVKIEFCGTRSRDGKLEIYANDLSRIVASKSFENRLRATI